MNDSRILVAYGSRHGATRQIALHIGEVLKSNGALVDVKPVSEIKNPAAYGAVLVGSAIYMGQWRPAVVKFLERHSEVLACRPLWIFASGPTGKGDPVELLEQKTIPNNVKSLLKHIQPREVKIFNGVLNPEELNPLELAAIRMVKAPSGDFRDWNDINQWAQGVAESWVEFQTHFPRTEDMLLEKQSSKTFAEL